MPLPAMDLDVLYMMPARAKTDARNAMEEMAIVITERMFVRRNFAQRE